MRKKRKTTIFTDRLKFSIFLQFFFVLLHLILAAERQRNRKASNIWLGFWRLSYCPMHKMSSTKCFFFWHFTCTQRRTTKNCTNLWLNQALIFSFLNVFKWNWTNLMVSVSFNYEWTIHIFIYSIVWLLLFVGSGGGVTVTYWNIKYLIDIKAINSQLNAFFHINFF